mgnify:FL=1
MQDIPFFTGYYNVLNGKLKSGLIHERLPKNCEKVVAAVTDDLLSYRKAT